MPRRRRRSDASRSQVGPWPSGALSPGPGSCPPRASAAARAPTSGRSRRHLQPETVANCARHLLDFAFRGYRGEDPALPVVVEKRRRLFRVDLETVRHGRLRIVGTLVERATTTIAPVGLGGRTEHQVERGPALPADATPGQPTPQLIARHIEEDPSIEV